MAWILAGMMGLALLPSLWVPWSLVDDGESLRRSIAVVGAVRRLEPGGLARLLVEREHGRARPVYWLAQTASYMAGGLSAPLHHALRIATAAATVALVALAARAVGGAWAGWMSGCLLLGSPTYENWYRLGPGEPVVALLIGLLMWNEWGRAGRPAHALVRHACLAALVGAKETAAAVAAPAWIWGILGRERGRWNWFWSGLIWACLGMAMVGWVVWTGGRGTHAARAGWSPEVGGRIAWYARQVNLTYGGLPVVLLATASAGMLMGAVRRRWTDLQRAQAVALAGTSVFLVPLGLWPDTLDRYLLPAVVWGALFGGLEVARLVGLLRHDVWSRAAAAAGLSAAAWCVIGWSRLAAGHAWDTARLQRIFELDAESVAWMAHDLPRDARVYLNHGELDEATYEIRRLLAIVYHRTDLIVKNYDAADRNIREGDAVLLHLAGPPSGILERMEPFRQPLSRVNHLRDDLRLDPAWQRGRVYMSSGRHAWTSPLLAETDNRWIAWRVVRGRGPRPLAGLDLPSPIPLSEWHPERSGVWEVRGASPAAARGREGGLVAGSTVPFSRLAQDVPVRPGGVYHLSAQIRVDDRTAAADNAFLSQEAVDSTGGVLARNWGIVTAATGWGRRESVIAAPPGTVAVRLGVSKRGGPGRVWFRDMRLAALEGPRFPRPLP